MPSRRRISTGITIRPSSSIRRTTPPALLGDLGLGAPTCLPLAMANPFAR
jgi:hypothetical protein